jgi:hypothetical protein
MRTATVTAVTVVAHGSTGVRDEHLPPEAYVGVVEPCHPNITAMSFRDVCIGAAAHGDSRIMTANGYAEHKLTCMSLVTLLSLCVGSLTWATPPIIFSQPAYQGPVRGDPGDLLMLPGGGFAATDTVVYQAVGATTQPLLPPAAIPTQSNASAGVAPIISALDVPHSLTVLLPAAMQTDQSYALWVQHTDGEWSNGILINDARPLWITPDSAYVTANTANLPRYLKVVGRNLQPAPGATTQVMLTGPSTYTLTATDDNYPTDSIDRYAAKVNLPTNMPVGTYSIQVSRDGVSWINVANGKPLTVNPDPVAPPTFPVGSYGGCVAGDGVDDTPCIVRAIAAARANGGGSVTFGPGVWDMSNNSQAGVVYFGVLVPQYVNLIGAGAGSTTIRRDTTWNMGTPIFTVQGNNTVQGITFQDAYVYQPTSPGRMLVGLGVAPVNAQSYNASDPSTVSNVVITQNVFDQPFVGIQDEGMPIDHLFVTNNDFGAYSSGLFLDETHFFSDSVIAYNTFEPGSYVNAAAGQGSIPTGVSAGQRVDFSNNIADGTSTQYLYNPATDPKGFRATFFWSLEGDHEQVLVSQNTSTCAGDKSGDGEAIAFDGNGNSSALPTAEPVLAATSNTVTVQGPLLTPPLSTAYTEYWVQVAKGTGLGQVRPVTAYSDPTGQTVVFTVSPAWDVIPGPDSVVTTSKEYWQVYTVDNFIDQRQPECTKGNVNQPAGGTIGFWAGSSDSAIEGNQQFDTGGIQYSVAYSVQSAQYGTGPADGFQTFLDIRHNTVEGEYDWAASCSYSGIRGWYGSSPDATAGPPIESYGVSISHNTVTQADDINGGAIALSRSWFDGPPPATWQFAQNTLVFNNTINNITNPPSGPALSYSGCTATYPRQGIHFDDALAWNSVLYANSCNNVAQNLNDGGTATLRACPATGSVPTNSCECSPYIQGTEVMTAPDSNNTATGAYPAAQNAGDLNLVVVNWDGPTQITSFADSSGNTYSLLGGSADILPFGSSPGILQGTYYAKNIAAATNNTVTVNFNGPTSGVSIRLAEYAGLDPANPLDVTASAFGTNSPADSGWVTTTNPNDLLVGIELTGDTAITPAPGYTARLSTLSGTTGTALIEDQFVTTTGAYHASASSTPSIWWLMQVVALRLANGGDTNTQALTAPSGLTAAAGSGGQINLSWTGSSDNIGVSGYVIERCAGASCVNFVQVGSVAAGVTVYGDVGLQASTTYTYRVRATDVATLMSGYSATASAVTSASTAN